MKINQPPKSKTHSLVITNEPMGNAPLLSDVAKPNELWFVIAKGKAPTYHVADGPEELGIPLQDILFAAMLPELEGIVTEMNEFLTRPVSVDSNNVITMGIAAEVGGPQEG